MRMLKSLGAEPITGKPRKSTTQGKNERVHSTVQRYLTEQPGADTLAELQEQLDAFRLYYNTECEHQALAGRTPQEAWDATPLATSPAPSEAAELCEEPKVFTRTASVNGTMRAKHTRVMLGLEYADQSVTTLHTSKNIMFFDADGIEIRTVPTPTEPGAYIGNNKPRRFMAYQQASAKS